MGQMMQATDSFVTLYNGREEFIQAGEVLDSDHEIVRRAPADAFRPMVTRFPVEEAVAAKKRIRTVKADDAAE